MTKQPPQPSTDECPYHCQEGTIYAPDPYSASGVLEEACPHCVVYPAVKAAGESNRPAPPRRCLQWPWYYDYSGNPDPSGYSPGGPCKLRWRGFLR
jgi:hypothetical protein